MHIALCPVRSEADLTVVKAGDTLTINGAVFDFSAIPDGATLPREAIDSDWFAGPVERVGGQLRLTLVLPHGADAPEHVRFPAPIENVPDGIVKLPAEETPDADD